MTKRKPAARGARLSVADDAKREAAFRLYRDMGSARTYAKLGEAMKEKYGYVSQRTFVTWARLHDWPARIAAWDQAHRGYASLLDLKAIENARKVG